MARNRFQATTAPLVRRQAAPPLHRFHPMVVRHSRSPVRLEGRRPQIAFIAGTDEAADVGTRLSAGNEDGAKPAAANAGKGGWWRWRESNPRPSVLRHRLYMRSSVY